MNTRFEKEEGCYALGRPWPERRDGSPDSVRRRLDCPVEGVRFDVEHNASFWHGSWGERLQSLVEALETARCRLADVPKRAPT